MNGLLHNGLYQTMVDVFEIVFLIPIESLDGSPPPHEMWGAKLDYLEVRVDLEREGSFPAFFFFPAGLVREIAGNFLGMDWNAIERGGLDLAGKVVARMTIGGLLGRVDPEASIRAGEPQVRAVGSFTPARLFEAPGAWVYRTGHGYLWVDLGPAIHGRGN